MKENTKKEGSNPLLNTLTQLFRKELGLLSCYTVMLDSATTQPNNIFFKDIINKTKSENFFCCVSDISGHLHKINKGIMTFNNTFNLQTFELQLPAALYLNCFSPMLDMKESSLLKAKKEIQSQVGFLRLIFGNGIAKELVFEGVLDINKGEYKDPNLLAKLHKAFEGPNYSTDIFSIYDEIKSKLNNVDAPLKGRIIKALQLVEAAATCKHEEYKFILYFTSIDLLFGEEFKPTEMIEKISTHYGRSKCFVKKKFKISKNMGFKSSCYS